MRCSAVVLALALGGCGLVLDLDPELDGGTASLDASERDAAGADGGSLDGAAIDGDAPPDACVSEPESCNGVDDDCDGLVDVGATCPPDHVCRAGQCLENQCAGGLYDCGDGCVSIETDPEHCGACGVVCAPGRECLRGVCERWVGVTAGEAHACGWTSSGRALCWGDNDRGQLGIGTRTSHPYPTEVPGLVDVIAMDAGTHHTCALDSSGALRCWGASEDGQLGVPGTGPRTTPVLVPGTYVATQVSAGERATGATLSGGTALLFGSAADGLLGLPPGAGFGPTGFTPPAGMIAQVTIGAEHGCALLANGAVLCGGSNELSQLGLGDQSDTPGARLVPGLSMVQQVETFDSFNLARAAGQVHCWGDGDGNPCGISMFSGDAVGDPTTIPRLAAATDISAGRHHGCAVQDGEAWCFGRSERGQRGVPGGGGLPTQVALGERVREVTCGGEFSCALTEADEIRCWGDNQLGQLGNGLFEPDPVTSPQPPVPLPAATPMSGGP